MFEKITVGLIVFFFVFCIVILPAVATIGWHHETGAGTQVGYVSATEKTGLIFKTGRAYIKPTLESTQEDVYCVIDDNVLLDLQARSVSKERVEVSHVSYFASGITNCEGEDAVITRVKVIE